MNIWSVSFVESLFLLCPYLGGSTVRNFDNVQNLGNIVQGDVVCESYNACTYLFIM